MNSKRKGCLIPAVLAAAVLIAAGAWLHFRGLGQLLSAWRLTSQWAQCENADFQASLRSGTFTLHADGCWTQSSEGRIYCLTVQDVPVYLRDDTLVLDNGRSYTLPPLSKTDVSIPELLLGILLRGQITAQNETVHFDLPDQNLAVTVTESEGTLSRLEIRASLPVNGQTQPLSLTVIPAEPRSHTVSAEILRALREESATPLLEPLEALLPAVQEIAARETVTGSLTVTVDCGVLTVDETLQLAYTTAGGALELRRGSIHIPVDLPELDQLLSPAALPLILLRNGSFSETAEGWLCTVDVEPELTKALFCALIPEMASLDFDFAGMEARILVTDGCFQTVILSGGGEIPFLMTAIPITVTMELTLD